jgi:hypothetical protein
MTTMRTFICPTCGATLATSAAPGTTIICEYCNSPFVVPAPSLDQPGDSQATVVANFRRRGNPSPMPPTGPDGTPPSTPEQPPAPDSPAGVGNTVDSDAVQPMVERGPIEPPAESAPPAAAASAVLAAMAATPEPAPQPAAEQPEPQIIEELDAAGEPPAEPEPPVPPAADPRSSEMTMIAPRRVRATIEAEAQADKARVPEPPAEATHEPMMAAAEPAGEAPANAEVSPGGEVNQPVMTEAAPEPEAPGGAAQPEPEPATIPMPEGVSVADILAEPTKYGAAIPSEQGEAIVTGPGEVKVVPPQTPAVGGPPGAAMRSGNRTPLMIGGAIVLACCLLLACVAAFGILPSLLNALR